MFLKNIVKKQWPGEVSEMVLSHERVSVEVFVLGLLHERILGAQVGFGTVVSIDVKLNGVS